MAPRAAAPALKTLLRASNAAIRQNAIATPQQPLSTFAQQASQPQTQAQSQSHSRSASGSRSPSPTYPHHAQLAPSLLSPNQWTRFTTPYSHTSIRTFTSTRARPSTPSTSPAAAQQIDAVIEEITELYGTAVDEFSIAAEETEKNTTYAAEDRAAAREELDRLLECYNGVLGGADRAVAEEVKRRVGQRVRELEMAVKGMEDSVAHGD